MGSGSSKALEHGGRRRRSRRLRHFSSLCFGFPLPLSDEQIVEMQRGCRDTACRGEAASISQFENRESYEGLAEPSIKPTSLISKTIDKSRELPFSMQQNDSGRSGSEVELCSGHSGCSCCPFPIIPEMSGSRIYRSGVPSPSEKCVRSGYDVLLDNRTGFMENILAQNSHHDRRSIARNEVGANDYSNTIPPEADHIEAMPRCRHHGSQGPLEGSMRFSRTLSVGRLRDRVHRRNALSEGLFGALLLEERLLSSQAVHSTENSQLHASENSQLRGSGNHNLLEHRSAFLQRARRIRSQVRALQRMGSRFENLSIHHTSCILSGHHRAGQCACRSSNRHPDPDVNNDTNSSSSISRIVMLAEALFEVLDEINQQSPVLSSRLSFSSVGSVPAPKEVVDEIPITVYVKPKTLSNQEVPQCYICLLEYEDGDCLRALPCQHEFHQSCVDKWLKEIHRVCPLCRGNVCC